MIHPPFSGDRTPACPEAAMDALQHFCTEEQRSRRHLHGAASSSAGLRSQATGQLPITGNVIRMGRTKKKLTGAATATGPPGKSAGDPSAYQIPVSSGLNAADCFLVIILHSHCELISSD
ncbi:hypothetical protein U0070_018586 [Myodes glareolus]|uniref:Uncharacterized protein n=1 Tax=Myodes glareolus TaxID=447135 RepID=A0AAW0IC66_MYOGA